jgi:uncharacterized protein YaaQ
MKLVMSIVNSDDAQNLLDELLTAGYRATMISTTGGFLREGNATIFVGTEDEAVGDVLEIIRRNCRTRTQYVSPPPFLIDTGELYLPTQLEVQVGGATVFVLCVDRFERF